MSAREQWAARIRRMSPMAVACLLVLGLYWAAAAIVLSVDPFNVYRWGKVAPLDGGNVTDDNKLLIAAVAKDPAIDLVVIGSSTAMAYSAADFGHAYPEFQRPYNLSYDGVRGLDRATVMALLAKTSRAKRLVVWLDWAYALPRQLETDGFPTYLYDSASFNDLRMVNHQGLTESLQLLAGRPLFSDYRRRIAAEQAAYAISYRSFQSTARMQALATQVAKFRPVVAKPAPANCSSLTALEPGLLAPLRIWSRSGRPADIVIPAYSPAFYYDRADPGSGVTLASQLLLRRCTIMAADRIPGVRVIALDADSQLIDDLANYKDPGHIYGPRPLRRSLDDLANGEPRISPGNVSQYLRTLRAKVTAFRIPAGQKSAFPPVHRDSVSK